MLLLNSFCLFFVHSKYPRLRVRVTNETVQDLRAIINRKHLAVRKEADTTSQIGPGSIDLSSENSRTDESIKEQSWEDGNKSRTDDWCSSLAHVTESIHNQEKSRKDSFRGRGNLAAGRTFVESRQSCKEGAGIFSVPVSEAFVQQRLSETNAGPSRQGYSRAVPLGTNTFRMGQNEMWPRGPSGTGTSNLGPSGMGQSSLGPVSSRLGPPTGKAVAEMLPTVTKSSADISPKRKYSSEESFERSPKIQVSLSPGGIPAPINLDFFWESDLPPKGFCFMQLERGNCSRVGCKFRHIPVMAVEEVR